MDGDAGERQLWSWIDRGDPALERHLAEHPEDRARVAALREAIAGVRAGPSAGARPERIGPYEIVGVLGEGAMGVVYEALQPNPRRRVALKLLRRGQDEPTRALFERETTALARLSHPGIAVIHEAACDASGAGYLVMELVEGLPLVAHAETRRLDRRARVALLAEVARAVQHAHARGVVHRDLKPSNVLVDAQGRPKVLDFGLARLADAGGATLSGSPLGTPGYMSPEQARGGTAGPPSDVYALGVMLYELVTGTLPIQVAGLSLAAVARRVAEAEPERPTRRVPELGRDLEAVILRCLEKDPGRRFADAGELADELERWRAGAPLRTRPPGRLARAGRLVRRHRTAAFLSVLVLLLAGLASHAVLFPTSLVWNLTGRWWKEGSPFEQLRWRGDVPEVALDGRWYELLAIDGLEAAYITGFCHQFAGDSWRKRFSEDLVQALNRMRDWCLLEVDLELRDLETDQVVRRDGVPLDHGRRQRIRDDRNTWPFTVVAATEEEVVVAYLRRSWRLAELEGVGVERLGERLYDSVCRLRGRSPGPRIDFVLESLEDGTRTCFRDVPRDGRTVLAERLEE